MVRLRWLLHLSRRGRWISAAAGSVALLLAGIFWLQGVFAGGLHVYRDCDRRAAFDDVTETVVQDAVPPQHVTCVYRSGETFEFVPPLLNLSVILLAITGLALLVLAYANVLADAWRRPVSSPASGWAGGAER